jgi:hypothetical protein
MRCPLRHAARAGCQMVCFLTQNPNLGKFWRGLDWKMLIYFLTIWNILPTFGVFYDPLVHFVFIWYIFPRFGIKYYKKSGNPGANPATTIYNVSTVKMYNTVSSLARFGSKNIFFHWKLSSLDAEIFHNCLCWKPYLNYLSITFFLLFSAFI